MSPVRTSARLQPGEPLGACQPGRIRRRPGTPLPPTPAGFVSSATPPGSSRARVQRSIRARHGTSNAACRSTVELSGPHVQRVERRSRPTVVHPPIMLRCREPREVPTPCRTSYISDIFVIIARLPGDDYGQFGPGIARCDGCRAAVSGLAIAKGPRRGPAAQRKRPPPGPRLTERTPSSSASPPPPLSRRRASCYTRAARGRLRVQPLLRADRRVAARPWCCRNSPKRS